MGYRKIIVKQTASESIAAIAWFIESKGLIATADRFTDTVYDYIKSMADTRKSFSVCKEPGRAAAGYKCLPFKKKYTIVFLETNDELIICEFISSKLIWW